MSNRDAKSEEIRDRSSSRRERMGRRFDNPDQQSDQYSLTAQVVGENGDVIDDATVTVDGIERQSGDSFELGPGEYSTRVQAANHQSTTREIVIDDADESVTIALDREWDRCQAETRSKKRCSNDADEGKYCKKHAPNSAGELTWQFKRVQMHMTESDRDELFRIMKRIELDENLELSKKEYERTIVELVIQNEDIQEALTQKVTEKYG
ncbi:peptidase associated/transthyretin-like domain-containing protein [Halalkalicoccus subterraneus]|uniref:hypothetical protein n=1 Tax=Halalkalicoccus subterraneus TaxID=2675002 RepID=UPI0013CEE84E|nr:hypothetical protein [Halalkalicoccus subterraneus]